MRTARAALIVFLALCAFALANATAGGLARSANFIVLGPDQELAEQVLSAADRLRTELAEDWFGQPIPTGIGATIIHVEVGDAHAADSGMFWAIDDSERKYHKLWLNTSRDEAVGSTLRHELTHVVFAARFPNRLPSWADEGAASLQDDDQRKTIRGQTLEWFTETGNWPKLRQVLAQRTISADDVQSYSVAASLSEYLLSIADKQTFLRFAQHGPKQGWDEALAESYQLGTVDELQVRWQAWVTTRIGRERGAASLSRTRPSDVTMRAARLPANRNQRAQ